MARSIREREVLTEQPGPEYWAARRAAGWRVAAVEWVREEEGEGEEARGFEEVPYGMQVAGDCRHLEENRTERQALVLMLDLIRQDQPLSRVAEELNRQSFRTRAGMRWGIESVFSMLPRLIEVAPAILGSREWEDRRVAGRR
jgi:hypothetical protein